jgi:hypothetical protein
MLNNRKQQIFSVLDSLTANELEKYIEERKLNNKFQGLLNKIKEYREPTHLQRLINKCSKDVDSIYEKYYHLGEARILAYFLYVLCHKDFETKECKILINKMLEDSQELKEMTYDIMKDF